MSIFQVSPPSFPAIWILCSANKENSFLCLFFAWTREDDYGSQISGASIFEILEFLLGSSKKHKNGDLRKKIKRETKRGWKMQEKNEWWRKVINREQNSRMSLGNYFFSAFVYMEREQIMPCAVDSNKTFAASISGNFRALTLLTSISSYQIVMIKRSVCLFL